MEGLNHISYFCGPVTSIPITAHTFNREHSTHTTYELWFLGATEEESTGCYVYLAGINTVLWCQGPGFTYNLQGLPQDLVARFVLHFGRVAFHPET